RVINPASGSLHADDPIAYVRVVGVVGKRGGQRSDDFIEELAGGIVVQIGEVERLRVVTQIGEWDELFNEQNRVHDLQRVRSAGDRPDLRTQVGVVPVDFRLGAEPVIGQLF